MTTTFIGTHAHLDGEEFQDDLPEVIAHTRAAGVEKIFVPAIDLVHLPDLMNVCRKYPGTLHLMTGLHPEEVRDGREDMLKNMKQRLFDDLAGTNNKPRCIAVGEVGLGYYWSREYEHEQFEAFEEQVEWAVECQLPLMIHRRKAQNEMVKLLRKYEKDLLGDVSHCFTGNDKEAAELLSLQRFVLGIGGVSTFKSSNLREMLPIHMPLNRIVLETDSLCMAPTPNRGKRNESAFVALALKQLAQSYQASEEEIIVQTNTDVQRVSGIGVMDKAA